MILDGGDDGGSRAAPAASRPPQAQGGTRRRGSTERRGERGFRSHCPRVVPRRSPIPARPSHAGPRGAGRSGRGGGSRAFASAAARAGPPARQLAAGRGSPARPHGPDRTRGRERQPGGGSPAGPHGPDAWRPGRPRALFAERTLPAGFSLGRPSASGRGSGVAGAALSAPGAAATTPRFGTGAGGPRPVQTERRRCLAAG